MIDRIIDYAKGISRVQFDNPKIISIVEEETGMYFAGDQTAEKCAEMIQNRVSLYLSEQNWMIPIEKESIFISGAISF